MESCLAVHSGSAGTRFWIRNQSRPGVECRVQYSRGWSDRICTPARMMKTRKNRLRKCCHRAQAGKPLVYTLKELMEFMGHSDLQMVQRYTKLLPQPEEADPAERLDAYLDGRRRG
jgi:integrase